MRALFTPMRKRGFSQANISFVVPKPFSLNTALMFSEKIVNANDSLVSTVPIRQAIAKKIAHEPRVNHVLWREVSGIAQAEVEVSNSVPLCPLSLDVGFTANSLLCYRFLKPTPVYNWQGPSPNQILPDTNAFFPTSAQSALNMPIGYEIELRGSGKLLSSQELSITQGVGTGFSASCATSQTRSGEYSLTVMALDGQKSVRVIIAHLNEEMAALQCELKMGLLGVDALALCANNYLKKLLENSVNYEIKALIKRYASVVASMTKASLTKQSTVCCYDLDLSKPRAQEAYEHLVRLNIKNADQLILQEEAGITAVALYENESRSLQNTDIQAFSKNLWRYEIADIECDGMVLTPDAQSAIYYEKTYAEKFSSIILGEQEIRWESIEILSNNKPPQKYYKFYHEQLANIPMQQDVDNFFSFASKLGIKSSGILDSELIKMNGLSKLVSKIDDTRTKIELFFSEAGVLKIQEADRAIGFLAFQKAHDHDLIPEEHRAYAYKMLAQYQAEQASFWAWLGFRSSLNTIIEEYKNKMGRSFDRDYHKFVKAKLFGELLANFCNAQDKKEARNFFAYIGKSPDFEYRETLLALAAIAGRENILVHKLSMSGGDVTLESIDEGEIRHPRDHAKNLFVRPHSPLFNTERE